MGKLDGKVALVTGASRGIGVAIARRFAADGATVAVTARTEEVSNPDLPGSIRETVDEITAAGGRAFAFRADLAVPSERQQLVGDVRKRVGPIDILVNNAAVTIFEPVATFEEKRYRLMFEVQVRAPFELAQLVLPDMKAAGRGWILNISSGAAIHPKGPPYRRNIPGGTVYGMCKAALERFTTGMAAEVWADNIAVNALSPSGLVPTPGTVLHGLTELVPKEMHEPDSVMAEAAYLLCTGDPREVTGRIAYSKDVLA